MKLVFLGTPEFAVPTLDAIAAAGHQIAAVYTQPDRPKGRGQKFAMPPVKEAALRLGLPVEQPERVRRKPVVEQLSGLAPDAMIVVGYGQILPQSILDIPPRGILNVHASLLPKYRGAAPIQWAIARGETETGVTIMKIDAGLDTGDMLTKWTTPIHPEETSIELGPRLAEAGAALLVQTLAALNSFEPVPQDDAQATYAPIIQKEDGHVDWTRPPQEIVNRVRGLVPWPGCYGFLGEDRFHIWKARVADAHGPMDGKTRGKMQTEGKRLLVGCGEGAIELLEVQLQGRKRMPVAAFLNGHSVPEGGEVLR